MVQVCQTLEYAHSRGVVHRDIKPQNIMIGEFGEVFIVDWESQKLTLGQRVHQISIRVRSLFPFPKNALERIGISWAPCIWLPNKSLSPI